MLIKMEPLLFLERKKTKISIWMIFVFSLSDENFLKWIIYEVDNIDNLNKRKYKI